MYVKPGQAQPDGATGGLVRAARPTNDPLPETFGNDDVFAHAPDYLWRTRSQRPANQIRYVSPCGTDDGDLVREYLAATYGLVEFIDDGVGRILAAIEQLGQTEDTIIVFTSDDGDMGGDHGLLLKGFMPFRGVQQVPRVIADPRQAPARTDALASSIDIGATLMDLCRVAAHDGIQGRSLAPALKDPRAQVRTSVLIEEDIRTGVAQLLGSPNRVRTVVTEQLKYPLRGRKRAALRSPP